MKHLTEKELGFPRLCAHRGYNFAAPENTLPALSAAVALGADEIEFDVWHTKDQRLVVCHDSSLDRISDRCGRIADLTLDEVLSANAGYEKGWTVPFCTPEDIFARLAKRIVFNIHLKETGKDGSIVREILLLAEKYNAMDSIYFAGTEGELEWIERIAPQSPRVAIEHPGNAERIAEIAKTYHCAGVQLWRDYFDQSLIDSLHADGIFCNLFWADSDEDFESFFDMGIDTLLTNRMDLAAAWKKRMQ